MNIHFNFKFLFICSIFLIVIGLSISTKEEITVEVKGEVKNPGVYKISDEKIVEDIINMAGLTEYSDISNINMGKHVYDEMVIMIPSNEEVLALELKEPSYKLIEQKCVCPKLVNDSCISLTVPSDEIIADTKISLNNASKEELMTLPGIGESKALLIIEYRKNNRFNNIEEIMNVKGIGKSIYEKIKDLISL